jgi:hypothetical protein
LTENTVACPPRLGASTCPPSSGECCLWSPVAPSPAHPAAHPETPSSCAPLNTATASWHRLRHSQGKPGLYVRSIVRDHLTACSRQRTAPASSVLGVESVGQRGCCKHSWRSGEQAQKETCDG